MKRNVDWNEIEEALNMITFRIQHKGLKPTKVLGIPRGGVILAVMMSHKFDIPYVTKCDKINSEDVLLIIDDISDSGTTMKRYYNTYFSENLITATLHLRPGSKFVPDYYYDVTEDWIVYAWETPETSKADYLEK